MYAPENTMNTGQIAALVQKAGPAIVKAVQKASASTGVNFAYLMEKASVESSFRPDVKNKSSSATGLYQFIEKTWMSMVKKYGDKYGLSEYAEKIDDSGRCSDPALRKKILSLRNDPEKAACMAAEYAAENSRYLEQHTETQIGSAELYLAHFMGPSGATQFLNAKNDNPGRNAARAFPEAASANHNVFYDSKTGKARSLQEVYDFFAQKFGDTGPVYAAAAPAPEPQTSDVALADAGNTIRMKDIIWNDSHEEAVLRLFGKTDDNRPSSSQSPSQMASAQRSPIPLMNTRSALNFPPEQLLMMASLDNQQSERAN